MPEHNDVEALTRSLRRWKWAAVGSWVAFALVLLVACWAVLALQREAAVGADEAERAARQAEEAARRRSEAEEARKAVQKQLAEARERHQRLIYANQISQAYRAWGHLEPKAPEGANGAQMK